MINIKFENLKNTNLIYGDPGSGKTYSVIQFIKNNIHRNFLIINAYDEYSDFENYDNIKILDHLYLTLDWIDHLDNYYDTIIIWDNYTDPPPQLFLYLKNIKIIISQKISKTIENKIDNFMECTNKKSSLLDQPQPKPSSGDCWKNLIERYSEDNAYKTNLHKEINTSELISLHRLMIERRKVGIERYNTVLQPFNGRDAIEDLLAEQLDSLAYSEQISLEKPELLQLMLEWQKSTIDNMSKLINFKKNLK